MPTRDTAWPQGTPCWVDLMVDDTTRAREFYSQLFGWDIQDGPPESGGYLTALHKGQPAAGIGQKQEGQEGMPSVWTTYLEADNADDLADKIGEAGGQVVVPPMDVLDLGRMVYAVDPTGAPFGLWQSKSMTGAGIYDEHGAMCWNELHTRDYAKAKDFYATLFGYSYEEIGDGETFAYSTFKTPGAEQSRGGINDETKMPGELPAYWLSWFQVDDVDAATTRATEGGSTVMMGPDDTPFGRMTVVQGPQGEVFGLIDPNTTTGEPPTPTAG
jgi:uncharacterized protein